MATLAFVTAATACYANYGRLQYNKEVDRTFQRFERFDGYAYYYSGRRNKPSAIIGINPDFEFSSRYWRVIPSDQFKTMVGRLSPPEYGFLNGAYMLTPEGRRAGVWYSWVKVVSFKFEGERIIVNSPEPFADADGSGFGRDPL
jgi:hypothetical protein